MIFLKISNELADKLRNLGIEVFQTRTIDETLSPNDRIKRIMNISRQTIYTYLKFCDFSEDIQKKSRN